MTESFGKVRITNSRFNGNKGFLHLLNGLLKADGVAIVAEDKVSISCLKVENMGKVTVLFTFLVGGVSAEKVANVATEVHVKVVVTLKRWWYVLPLNVTYAGIGERDRMDLSRNAQENRITTAVIV